jgi:hypothetical protein
VKGGRGEWCRIRRGEGEVGGGRRGGGGDCWDGVTGVSVRSVGSAVEGDWVPAVAAAGRGIAYIFRILLFL